ncbi:MAG: SPOR domain-containing protein, partial [Rhodospirillales bacterium]|nr:SPOR domain-containing protein [Rhodospirillales bacterium]
LVHHAHRQGLLELVVGRTHGAALAGVTPEFEPVDQGARGSLIRILAGPYGSKGDAAKLCTRLKLAECAVVAK